MWSLPLAHAGLMYITYVTSASAIAVVVPAYKLVCG